MLAVLKTAFDACDKDHDGKIDFTELVAVIKAIGAEEDTSESDLQDAIKTFGDPNTGKIDFEGFKKFSDDKMMGALEDFEDDNELPGCDEVYLLTVFDKYGKGKMSVEQLQKALTLAGETLDEQAAKDLLKKYDSDKDGFMTYDEYRQLISQEFDNDD